MSGWTVGLLAAACGRRVQGSSCVSSVILSFTLLAFSRLNQTEQSATLSFVSTTVQRFKQLRLTAADCEALSQSQEGSSSLTQLLAQRRGSQTTHRGLYPTHRTKKRPRVSLEGAGQRVITSYFRRKNHPSSCPTNMAKSPKVKAEEPLESLLAGDDFLGPEDLGSLHEGRRSVAASKHPRFSPSGHNCPVDGIPWEEDQLGRRAGGPAGDGLVKQEAEDQEGDPLDSRFGLLGTMHLNVPQGHIDQLPDEVLREIFALLPVLSLCQELSLVCRRWRRIISDPRFIPWKKLYHQYLKGKAKALSSVEKILQKYGLIQDQKQCMLGFIRCLGSVTRRCIRDPEATLQCLESHPLFPKAEICISKRLPDLESPTSRASYIWAVVATIVLFSGGVPDIRDLVACLQRPSSTLSLADIMEALYCMALLLYAMREKKVNISSRIHYSIFYYLYLLENSTCDVAVVTPEVPHCGYKRGSSSPGMQLTCEQRKILNHEIAPGQVVKILAFAGTGKTSTLVRYAETWSSLRFLYLAFNRTIAQQATGTFPPNVTCKTIHSLAFAKVGKRYSKKLNPGSLSTYCVSLVLHTREGMSVFIRAKTVVQTLATFFASADDAITSEHVPIWCKDNRGERVLIQPEERRIVIEEAERIWSNMKLLNPTREMAHKMTHDGYLKLWQLERPVLSEYDAIFVDEAQDCTPAIMQIIRSQPCGVILVGDPHQRIYSFRGAVSALSEVPHSHIFRLTQSFRFGPEIAYVAAAVLDICKEVRKKILVGSDRESDISGTHAPKKVARLCRSNRTVFDDAVNVTSQDPPPRIHLLGGLKAFGLEKILDLWRLLHPESKLEVRDPFLRHWVRKGFSRLRDYAAKVEDKQLEMKIAIVEKYRDRTPGLVERISQCHINRLEEADYIVGTVHKAKGLEFDAVQIAPDFFQGFPADPSEEGRPADRSASVPDDEWNLLYVAITRAKRCLIMPQFLCYFLTLAGEHYLRPELTSEVCKEAPPPCTRRGCYGSILAKSILTMKKMPFVYSDGTKDPGGFRCHHCVNQCLRSLIWLTVPPEVVSFPEDVFAVQPGPPALHPPH
ncbi:F-box DNA helicase 1 isoform X1 [Varanus komodoensis]|uniref:F-box DNA helicase 1 n=2 Tax=Varanus komodoensis TaxID=61221 RepID=A0A8D2KQN9_VARKO|nr:F-box DNA helicase 1 isoform X1 [Varanus komodoensis]